MTPSLAGSAEPSAYTIGLKLQRAVGDSRGHHRCLPTPCADHTLIGAIREAVLSRYTDTAVDMTSHPAGSACTNQQLRGTGCARRR